MDVDWQADLHRWLAPFVAALRHKTRARMCPAYIAGLIGPGDRKSVQPMAMRAGEVGYDQLHHFIAAGVWDSAPLEAVLLKKADGWSAIRRGFLSSTTRRCPRRESFGRRRATICLVTRKDRQLPVAGLANVGVARGAGDGGPAAIPARELDR